jgi:hypothetical protein
LASKKHIQSELPEGHGLAPGGGRYLAAAEVPDSFLVEAEPDPGIQLAVVVCSTLERQEPLTQVGPFEAFGIKGEGTFPLFVQIVSRVVRVLFRWNVSLGLGLQPLTDMNMVLYVRSGARRSR